MDTEGEADTELAAHIAALEALAAFIPLESKRLVSAAFDAGDAEGPAGVAVLGDPDDEQSAAAVRERRHVVGELLLAGFRVLDDRLELEGLPFLGPNQPLESVRRDRCEVGAEKMMECGGDLSHRPTVDGVVDTDR